MAEERIEAMSAMRRKVWLKRRPDWTRSDSVRWLNERSSGVLAWVRRRDPARSPGHSNSMGRWLAEHWPVDFARAHERLAAAASEAAREQRTVLEVVS